MPWHCVSHIACGVCVRVRARGYVRIRGHMGLRGCECSFSGGIVEKADCMKRSNKRVTLVSAYGIQDSWKRKKMDEDNNNRTETTEEHILETPPVYDSNIQTPYVTVSLLHAVV